MLQVAQNYRTGTIGVYDVPPPVLRAGGILVRTRASVISPGTERSKVELARKSWLAKARERPDAVRLVLDTLRREGPAATYRRVLHQLDRLTPIGYSAAGVVVGVGEGVTAFRVGDAVAVGGGGYANHAEVLWVPQTLATRVSEGVDLEQAAFATLGAIALHALRLAQPQLGETVAVIGLGLVGQLAVRLALAGGARVVACDLHPSRIAHARNAGALAGTPDELDSLVREGSGGLGADVVVVAAASRSAGPIRLAGEVSRDRGRVVAVGSVGLDVPRELYYRKELTLHVSRSYGPGRYDPSYEEKGNDYPIGFVRWTEGRNLAAIVQLLATDRLDVRPLISRRFPIAEAAQAYRLLLADESDVVSVVLEYPTTAAPERVESPSPLPPSSPPTARRPRTVGIGLIGIGSFAANVLIPALRRVEGVRFIAVTSASGLSAQDAVRRYGFERAVGSPDEVIADPGVDAVMIVTPHSQHALLVGQAVAAAKPVFVEKPLVINWEQWRALKEGLPSETRLLVGFNRRFSAHTRRVRELLAPRRGAAMITVRVNAGRIAPGSWIHDPAVGGGRLIGEGCHFIDLCTALLGMLPGEVRAEAVRGEDVDAPLLDNFVASLQYPDGSLATVVYTSKGDPTLGKERVEVFCDGWAAVIDNFDRTLVTVGGRRRRWRGRGDKGHRSEIAAFIAAVRDGTPMPVPLSELLASTEVTLRAYDMALGGEGAGLVG